MKKNTMLVYISFNSITYNLLEEYLSYTAIDVLGKSIYNVYI